MEVACEANELWGTDLKLHEQWLKVTQKQLARQECLIGMVETLTDALVCLGLVGGSLSWDALQVDLVHSDDHYCPPIPPLFQSDLVRLLDRYYFFLFP